MKNRRIFIWVKAHTKQFSGRSRDRDLSVQKARAFKAKSPSAPPTIGARRTRLATRSAREAQRHRGTRSRPMAGAPGSWPFAGGVPQGHAANGAQWFSGVAGQTFQGGEAGNPGGTSSGDGTAGGAAGSVGAARAADDTSQPSASGGTSTHDSQPSNITQRPVAKVRKPYTITKQRERWSEDEHARFLDALKLHGRAWRKIEEHIGTKSAVQIRSHAQKFFSKLQRETARLKETGADTGQGTDSQNQMNIPPARPKRKPNHPYPRKAPDGKAGGGSTLNAPTVDTSAILLQQMQGTLVNPMSNFVMPSPAQLNAQQLGALGAAAFAAAMKTFSVPNATGAFDPAVFAQAPGAVPTVGAPTQPQFNPYTMMQSAMMNNPMAAMQAAMAQAGAGGLSAAQLTQQQQMMKQIQMTQQAQASQFFAALATIGRDGVPQVPLNASTAVPVEVQRPGASRPASGETNGHGSADFYAAMLAAAAGVAKPNGATGVAVGGTVPSQSTVLSTATPGSAFSAFTDASVARPTAEQMTALANVMMYFPGGALANAGAGGAAPVAEGDVPRGDSPSSQATEDIAVKESTVKGEKPGFEETQVTDITGLKRKNSDDSSKDGDEAREGQRNSSPEGGGSGAGSGDDDNDGGAGSGDQQNGSGSGSGEGGGGSGQSAQTKQQSSGARGSSRGFESSSQREKSPPQPRESR